MCLCEEIYSLTRQNAKFKAPHVDFRVPVPGGNLSARVLLSEHTPGLRAYHRCISHQEYAGQLLRWLLRGREMH